MSASQSPPAHWRKSSYSGNGPTCLETADLPHRRAVRDSRNPERGFLTFADREWRSFIFAVKAEELGA